VEVAKVFARVASFEGGDNARLRQWSEEAMSSGEMNVPEGMQRVLMLDDDSSSKRLFISFFDSREAIEAAEAGFDAMGDTIPEDVRGRRTSVGVYEVTLDQNL
jgi:hypothetical protein